LNDRNEILSVNGTEKRGC